MLLVLPGVAHAAGLGKLAILSALGQPLLAEVDLISVQDDALATLKARIALPEAFAKANVQYSPALVGVRVSIERRSDGRPYIKIISTRPVNEPFIDFLVELSWPQGHLVREYTALIDPPRYTPGAPIVQAVPPVKPAPAVTLESQALALMAPVKAKPAAKALAVTRAAGPARTEGKEYGPVKRGDTLSKIAASVKPEGVTLEQMLVSLYQANRDAFGGNMNILYEGSMLRIPEEHQVVATARSEAMKEVRDPATDKQKPMEVLRLSVGEPPGSGRTGNGKGMPRELTERLRVLEAELDALEKALTESNKLVVQLEQTVRNMQRRMGVTEQLPGVAAAGTLPQPASGDQPGAVPPVKGDPVAQPGPARAEPAKTGLTAEAPGSGEQAAPAAQPAAAGSPQGGIKAEAPKAGAGAPTQPKPKPTEIVQAPPDRIYKILAQPWYLAGGGLLALLGGAGYWFARRRRMQITDVDPLAKADLFLGFGRDHQKIPHHVQAQTRGAVNSSPGAAVGGMVRAVDAQDIARDAGAARAAAEATPAVAVPGSTLKSRDGMQPPAAPDKTSGAVINSAVAPLGERARAVDARDVARDAGAAHAAAEAAPEFVALDFTFKFPDEMQPPGAPGGRAVKTGVKGDPAAPKGGTIDFGATAPAAPGDDKDSNRDDTVIPVSRKP